MRGGVGNDSWVVEERDSRWYVDIDWEIKYIEEFIDVYLVQRMEGRFLHLDELWNVIEENQLLADIKVIFHRANFFLIIGKENKFLWKLKI